MKSLICQSILAMLVATTTLLALTGCETSTGLQVQHDSYDSEKNAITDNKFGDKLLVSQVKGSSVGALQNGNVVVKNNTKSTMSLQYQFTWYDATGREIDAGSQSWNPITIYGKNEKTLSGVAPNPAATQFRVSIRELNATKVFKTNFLGIK